MMISDLIKLLGLHGLYKHIAALRLMNKHCLTF